MKKSDLYREYARVIDMCEGAGIDPRLCWKCLGVIQSCSPLLNATPEEYEFALAIVEGKPVFVGDVLYDSSGFRCTIGLSDSFAWVTTNCSWTPPKPKTITVTIPRPDNVTWNDYFVKLFGDGLNIYRSIKEAMK